MNCAYFTMHLMQYLVNVVFQTSDFLDLSSRLRFLIEQELLKISISLLCSVESDLLKAIIDNECCNVSMDDLHG